jgi:hypothetical protein
LRSLAGRAVLNAVNRILIGLAEAGEREGRWQISVAGRSNAIAGIAHAVKTEPIQSARKSDFIDAV